MGRTHMISHHLETASVQLGRVNPWPLPKRMWETVLVEIQVMLRMGIIEEFKSTWESPIVMVLNMDGMV